MKHTQALAVVALTVSLIACAPKQTSRPAPAIPEQPAPAEQVLSEPTAHTLVRHKQITRNQAQTAISADWIAAFKECVGERQPHKPTNYRVN